MSSSQTPKDLKELLEKDDELANQKLKEELQKREEPKKTLLQKMFK